MGKKVKDVAEMQQAFTFYVNKALEQVYSSYGFYNVPLALELLSKLINWYCTALLAISGDIDPINAAKYKLLDVEFWTNIYSAAKEISAQLETEERVSSQQ